MFHKAVYKYLVILTVSVMIMFRAIFTYTVGVPNGQGGTLRDSETRHIFSQPEMLFADFLCFQNSRLMAFCEKMRLRDPRKLIGILQDSEFLQRPFDTPSLFHFEKQMMLEKKPFP